MTRDYCRIFLKVILVSKQSSKVNFWTSKLIFEGFKSIFETSMPPMHENYSILLDLDASNASELFHILDLNASNASKLFHILNLNASNASELFHILNLNASNASELFHILDLNASNASELFHIWDLNASNASELFHIIGPQCLQCLRAIPYFGPRGTATTAAAAATAAVSQELWNLGGALVQRAQEPNIPFGESLTSILAVLK